MKFNPTVNQLVLIALLFLAIIGANIVAPGVVGIVTSLASVLIGYGAGAFQGGQPPADAHVAPVISIVKDPKEGPDGGAE